MGKVWMLVTVVGLTLSMVAGCVGEAEEVVKTYTDPDQVINIGIGQEFVITLSDWEATIGFSWQAEYDDTMLKLLDSESWIDVYGGTFQQSKFMALKTGETEITMIFSQKSEHLKEQLGKKVFTVNIKQASP